MTDGKTKKKYKEAGVDIEAGKRLVESIKPIVKFRLPKNRFNLLSSNGVYSSLILGSKEAYAISTRKLIKTTVAAINKTISRTTGRSR